jgi:hypothetical protein
MARDHLVQGFMPSAAFPGNILRNENHKKLPSNHVLYYIWIRNSGHLMLILAIKSIENAQRLGRNTGDALSKPLLTLGRPASFLDILVNALKVCDCFCRGLKRHDWQRTRSRQG